MSDPSLPLQAAFVAACKALNTAASTRVYDIVPRGPTGAVTATFPFIAFGSPDATPIDEDCKDRTDTTVVLDFWSRAVGFPEAKTAAALMRDRFHEGALTVTGHTIDRMFVERIDNIRDPDGLTSRVRLTINVQTTPT
jgi:hypothetical protein